MHPLLPVNAEPAAAPASPPAVRSGLLDLRGLPARIAVAVILLVAALQIAAAWVVVHASNESVRARVREELTNGVETLHATLRGQGAGLRRSAQLLAADPRLRDAADARQALRLLAANAELTGASLLQIVDAQGLLASLGGEPVPAGVPSAPLSGPVETLQQTVVLSDARAYDMVAVPIDAGRHTLILARSFDRQRALRLREYTGIDVTFALMPFDGAQATLLGSSLAADAAEGILRSGPPSGDEVLVRALDGGDRALRAITLHEARGGRLLLVATRALDDAAPVFEHLLPTLVAIAVGNLVLVAAAGLVLVRMLLRPLHELNASAMRIRDGDYRQPIDVRCSGELATLRDSLDHMRVSIAQREERISHLAYDDPLTGLPNRARLVERIDAGLRDARLKQGSFVVMALDLDRFKQINDTLGHAAGDEVLRLIATRLNLALRPVDTVARLGSDEFALVLPGTDAETALEIARGLRKLMREPLEYGQQTIDVGASIGIAVHPNDGHDADALLRCADIAVQAAKRNNASIALYDARHEVARREYLSLLSELRRAVEESQLRAYYQPVVELSSGRAVGAEALMRWRHPVRGLLSPAEFMPYAEQTGYILVLTRWMLAVTLRQCGAWAAAGLPLEVAVNISTRDLMGRGLVQFVAENLRLYHVPPALVTLEITEGVLMHDPEHALSVLQQLRALGVKLAIDDFGTGFSSLAYLKRMPVHELKIDAAFVKSMSVNAKDASIVRSTIQLAHNLQLRVVAEGVEDEQTFVRLRDMGCDMAQGYFLARPMRRAALEQWMRGRPQGGLASPAPG